VKDRTLPDKPSRWFESIHQQTGTKMIKLNFWTNDIDGVFDFFQSIEMIESVFGIQYAWEDGSFDSEKGDLDLDVVKWKGKVYTDPLQLTVMYDEESRSWSDTFSKPVVKLLSKQQLHQYKMWKLESR